MSTDTGRGEHPMEPAERDRRQGEEAEARVRAGQAGEEDDPEEFAEAAGVDPTPQEVDEYRERIGEPPAGPREPPDRP